MTDDPGAEPPRSSLAAATSLAVVGVTVLFVGLALARFWPNARQLWWSMIHDRNAHYWAAQSVALDIRNGDPIHLARDIERMRVWGPLHPTVTVLVLAVGGIDYRMAVLPAAVAWGAAAWLPFLAARRIAPAAVIWPGSAAWHPGACRRPTRRSLST